LNLGHTFGHAIEAAMGYGTWLHGEAVATGTVLAAEMSAEIGWLNQEQVRRVRDLFSAAGLPVSAPRLGVEQSMHLMSLDKKVKNGRIRLVLLKGLGQAVVTADYPADSLTAVLEREMG
jgi:3-dehydroquinate synthase